MGLKDTLKKKLRSALNRLSGEYSAVAPEELIPYDVPGKVDESVKVQRARLKRPPGEAGDEES
jgi:hypothetical protein